MSQVNMGKKSGGMVEGMIPGLIGMAGTAIGSYYGGTAGGAVGGQIGGMVGQAAMDPGKMNAVEGGSTPRDRYQQQMEKDPVTQLQKGKAALAGMDEQDRAMLEPAINEALIKAQKQRQKPDYSTTQANNTTNMMGT